MEEKAIMPCKCGAMPSKETRPIMGLPIRDGGYMVLSGRLHCDNCGFGVKWGNTYVVRADIEPESKERWEKNIDVWNRMVARA